jgi:hypothetical protein
MAVTDRTGKVALALLRTTVCLDSVELSLVGRTPRPAREDATVQAAQHRSR